MIASFLSATFASAHLLSLFFCDHLLLIFATCFAVIVVSSLSSYVRTCDNNAEDAPAKDGQSRVSPISEADEEDNVEADLPSSRVAVGLSRARRTEQRPAEWIIDPKRIYKKLLKGGRRTPPNEAAALLSGSVRPSLKRRHSSGPLQFARAAKDFIVHGRGRFLRQFSDFDRSALPKPPTEFFEPTDLPEVPKNLAPETFYLLQSLKMLELPSEWMLNPKDIVVESFKTGEYLARPGAIDDSIFIVLEGSIAVHIIHGEGKEYMVRKIDGGDCCFSLLSLLEVLMENEYKLRNISVRAVTNCRVARYKMHSFHESYVKNPELWHRPIQIVTTRLLHVTMTTLYQYLGLSCELMKKRFDEKRTVEGRNRRPSGSDSVKLAHRPKARARRTSSSEEFSEQVAFARRWFADALNLGSDAKAMAFLNEHMKLLSVTEDQIITKQNTTDERLMMLVNGTLKLMQNPVFGEEDSSEEGWQMLVHPRELVGGLQLLTTEPAFYSVTAYTDATIAYITKDDFDELNKIRPEATLAVAHSVTRRLSPFLRNVDFAIDWVLLDSGQAVYRSGDSADSLFVVLSGRLRSVEKKTVVEEFGRGDMLGMVEVLQRIPRSTTVLAIRFSQLARVPEGLLNYIKMKYPQVGFRLVHLLGHYFSSTNRRPTVMSNACTFTDHSSGQSGDPMSHIKNLHTIAVIAASQDVPIVAFTCELYHALNAYLRVIRLSSKKVAEILGPAVLEKQADFRLMHWLNLQEDTYPLVIYECDNTPTNWTRRCLRQADSILLVATGEQKPLKHSFMEEYLNMNQDGIRTSKELILLWDEGTKAPQGTYEWLKGSYFSGHHHIRTPKRMSWWSVNKKATEHDILEYYEQNVFPTKVDNFSDFSRLARILTGNAVGVVLGGGGARGAAHVGVVKAMREHGIPIDIIGGTSIGSFIGGLLAESEESVEDRAREWFMTMSSLWRKIWDLTYAHSAMFTGAGFNAPLQSTFADREIEDLWISYFCVTTDISNSEMRVHRSGRLWSYSRASMSLAGYLPPLCDPVDGHLLLDGGYVNNLPADVMKSLGAKTVIAIDVASATETNLLNYGDTLSGFWVLLRRLNPFAEPVKVLNMEEIQSRLAYVSCVRQLEQVKKAPYCHYIRPPIEAFKTLDFAKFDLIKEAGYKYGTEVFDELVKTNESIMAVIDAEKLRLLKAPHGLELSKLVAFDHTMASSFTNLAAQVSKIPKAGSHSSSNNGETSDEDILEGLWDRNRERSPQLSASEVPEGSSLCDSVDETGYFSEPCVGYREHKFYFDDELSAEEEDHGRASEGYCDRTGYRRRTFTDSTLAEHRIELLANSLKQAQMEAEDNTAARGDGSTPTTDVADGVVPAKELIPLPANGVLGSEVIAFGDESLPKDGSASFRL